MRDITIVVITLLVCYKIDILDVPPEVIKLIIIYYLGVLITFSFGASGYVLFANTIFDISLFMENSFLIVKHRPFQLGYEYIDALLPKLEEICGKMTVRALYTYKSSKNPDDETLPTSANYRDTWVNNPSRKIMGVVIESEENSSDHHLSLSFKRVPIKVYAGSFLQGEGFGTDDRERILKVIENEQWRLKPKYSLLVNIRLGFTYLVFIVVGQVILSYFWDASYGHTVFFVLNIIILFVLLFLLWLKSLIFPAGTFCIDHEVEEIKEREGFQKSIIKNIRRFFWWLLYFLGIKFV